MILKIDDLLTAKTFEFLFAIDFYRLSLIVIDLHVFQSPKRNAFTEEIKVVKTAGRYLDPRYQLAKELLRTQ